MSISCLSDALTFKAYLLCLDTTGITYAIMLIGLTTILVTGWSIKSGITDGLMIGGFFSSLIGIAMVGLEFVPAETAIIPLVLLMVGIILSSMNKNI